MSSPQKQEIEALERALSDPRIEPVKLSYPTIEEMTQEFSNKIGHGGYGVVYVGTLPSGKIAVKKLFIAHDFDDTLFMAEINCLIRAKHKNIVRFLGYCADVDNRMVEYKGRYILVETRQRILCFEYVPNGDLHGYLKGEPTKDEWQMRYIMIKEIIQGLQCLHGSRINHLDLKPENILMDAHMRPKISDFGLSRCFDEGQSRIFTNNVYGTRGYIAPEIIDKGEISLKSDIFSLGIIIIKLLTGRNNYDIDNWDKLLDVDGPQAKTCIEIAQSCTHADQHKRPTVDEVLDKLNAMESMIQEPRKDMWSSIKQMNRNILERMLLDESAEPMNLTLSLLEDITNRFSLDHQIGSGGFAVVYKGTVGKLRVAVKKLAIAYDLSESKFHTMVQCLMKARHRNIVRFLGYCAETQRKDEDWEGRIVMADTRNWLLCFEYVTNGSLEKYITDASDGLEWKERFRIIEGICHGLHYLHKKRILHLDLKPANILLDDHMEPKIADFSLSRCLSKEQTHGTTKHLPGTPGYLAPEFFSGKYAFASDIYSLGVIIMEILTGAKGYPEDENVIESWVNRLEGAIQFKQVRVCIKIVKGCMESDPKKRPVARHIIDMLDTTRAGETGMSRKLSESLGQDYIKERPDADDVAGRLGNDHFREARENTNDWSSWKAQDTEPKEKDQGTSIFRSVFDKLNIFKIFKRGPLKKLARDGDQVPRIRIRIFRKEEIEKITRNYSILIGKGRFSTVYKGILPDNTIVSVKTSTKASQDILMEAEIGTQLNHPNILKLIGCCLEVDVPIWVHEFATKGCLRDILHGDQMLPVDLRLDIAVGIAEGLRYMHSGGIRHGDVRPHTILLDETLTPKISGFELSQLLDADGSFSTTTVVGCMGYIDPVFMETGLLTKKSDVYSFGAVLLELITRKKNVYNDNCNLIVEYSKCYKIEKSGRALFDKKIAAAEDISTFEEIGQLAIECLREDIEERPDMTEVTVRLVMIRRGRRLQKARNAR